MSLSLKVGFPFSIRKLEVPVNCEDYIAKVGMNLNENQLMVSGFVV